MPRARSLLRMALACACVALLGCDAVSKLRAGKDAGPPIASGEPAPPPTPTDGAPIKRLDLSGLGSAKPATSPGPGAPASPGGSTPAAAGKVDVAALERTFASFDINKDDQLDGVEVTNCGCRAADANGDGEITKAEYLASALVPGRGSSPPAPAPAAAPSQAPSPAPAAPAAAGEGMVPGRYPCSALIGGVLSTTGEFRVLSSSTYQISGGGVERYAFDPGSGRVTWLSGLYADASQFRDATYTPAKRMLRMRAGKSSQWTCRLDGKIL